MLKQFIHLPSNVQRIVFSYTLQHEAFSLFNFCPSDGCQIFHFYLICMCLTARKTEHLFICHLFLYGLPIHMSSPFYHWFVWVSFVNVFIEVVCILKLLTPYLLYALQIFFSLFCIFYVSFMTRHFRLYKIKSTFLL